MRIYCKLNADGQYFSEAPPARQPTTTHIIHTHRKETGESESNTEHAHPQREQQKEGPAENSPSLSRSQLRHTAQLRPLTARTVGGARGRQALA